MIVSVSIFLVGSVKVKLMRYFESSEITRYNMLNQQGISQQNIAIFYLMVRYCIVKQSAVLRALFSYFDRAMIPIVRPATAAAPPAIAPAVSQLS